MKKKITTLLLLTFLWTGNIIKTNNTNESLSNICTDFVRKICSWTKNTVTETCKQHSGKIAGASFITSHIASYYLNYSLSDYWAPKDPKNPLSFTKYLLLGFTFGNINSAINKIAFTKTLSAIINNTTEKKEANNNPNPNNDEADNNHTEESTNTIFN